MNYRLDLETLLHMLGQSSGLLEADFFRISGVRGRCSAHLILTKGSITSCSIVDERKVVLFSQEAAFKRIEHLVLEWHYTESSPLQESSPRNQLTPARSFQLRRIRQFDPQEFQSWPRLYRSIFALTAQPISVERIVALLARDQEPESIKTAISVLIQRGILQLENGSSRGLFP